jgi:hypothetical protein
MSSIVGDISRASSRKIRANRTFAGDSWRQWPRNVRSVPDADAHPLQRVAQILDKRLRLPVIVGQNSPARVYVRALNREQVDADTRLGSWPRAKAISVYFNSIAWNTRLNTDTCLNSHRRLTDKHSRISYSLCALRVLYNTPGMCIIRLEDEVVVTSLANRCIIESIIQDGKSGIWSLDLWRD